MRLDHFERAFTGIGQAAVASLINVSAYDFIYISVESTSVTGAPTSWHFDMVPTEADGDQLDTQADSYRTENVTVAAGSKVPIDRIRTQVVEPVIRIGFPAVTIKPDFTGGTTPTVTGIVHVIGRIL